MGGIGAVAEPLVVVALLFGGTWINRDFNPGRRRRPRDVRRVFDDGRAGESASLMEDGDVEARSASPSLLGSQEPMWRKRTLGALGWKTEVATPNTRRFKGYFLSRLLERFPFLVECWYWALIYWVSYANIYALPPLNRLGISTWSSSDSSLYRRRHCSRRTKPCLGSHICGGEAGHILGIGYPAFLHAESVRDDLDQSNILLHSHPRLDCFPGLALLLYKYSEQNRRESEWEEFWGYERISCWSEVI
jgi:hypothetical protein